MESNNWIISVDDHVIEPSHVWQERVPVAMREAAPQLRTDDKGEAWFYDGKRIPTSGLAATAGKKKEEFSPLPVTYDEMRPGCYNSVERLADMNRDNVLASMCFPSFPRFCGQTFYEGNDRALAAECVRAYNDWMIEEWCGSAPGRFIPLIILPLWDPIAAAAEIERTAAMGAKAITFSENPHKLGLPSIHDADRYWDPVFSAAQEAGMPICTHIGSSSQLPSTSPDNPLIVSLVLTPLNSIQTCVDWLFSDVFKRFPRLKLCLSEGGIGWIPFVLERCEYTVDRQGAWASKIDLSIDMSDFSMETRQIEEAKNLGSPMDLFREHVFGCFIDDVHGTSNLDLIGVDNVMIEVDYPHSDSSWPNSLRIAEERLAGRSDEDKYKILRGNAERVFDFEPAAVPAVVNP